MPTLRGVQFEVLASLTVVMVTATGLLAAFMIRTQAVQLEQVRGLIGRALVEEARAPGFVFVGGSGPTEWWLERDGELRTLGGEVDGVTEPLRDIAAQARRSGGPIVGLGRPWQPLRFAIPVDEADPSGDVAVGRIAPVVSGRILLALVFADCVVFIGIGAYLLRRRVLAPLGQLSRAARAIAEGECGTRVHVEGSREAEAVAGAFNEMSEALEARTGQLEKAIDDLRQTNRSLRTARDGLDRAERLASVGTLAAGVAHEVGNPMGALLAFLELARRDERLADSTRTHLARASEQGERVREIIRQLLDFSRPPRAQREPIDVVALANQATTLVLAQKRYAAIRYVVHSHDALPRAMADQSIVAQIFLNLVINASDAVRATSDPRVEIEILPAVMSVREGDETTGAARARSQVEGIECRVADNGPGVAPEDRERIFDPFYTTKDPGEGTGLGLANALRLAEESGGSLELLPDAPLGGATFALRLPVEGEGGVALRGDSEANRESRSP